MKDKYFKNFRDWWLDKSRQEFQHSIEFDVEPKELSEETQKLLDTFNYTVVRIFKGEEPFSQGILERLMEVNGKRSAEAFDMPVVPGKTEKEILLRLLLGLQGEAAEVGQEYRKILEDRKDASFDDMLEEIADTIIYACLIADAIGGDLPKAIKDTFNKVSENMSKKLDKNLPKL